MAVDSKEKRMSVAGLGLPWMAIPLPTGTIDAAERASIAALYSGNAFGEAVEETPGSFWIGQKRGVDWTGDTRGIDWTSDRRSVTWTAPPRT